MLQQGGAEERAVDGRGGRAAGGLHKEGRRRKVADAAQEGGAPPLREELPPPVDELPPPLRQARPYLP